MTRVIFIIGLIVGISFITQIYATTFSVDNSSYEYGDVIILTGFASPVNEDQLLSVQILNPSQSDFAQIDTFAPNSDGSFSRSYMAEGPKWNMDGTYTLKLFYNGDSFQTTFEFSINPPSVQETKPPTEQESKPIQEQEPETLQQPEPDNEEESEPIVIKQGSKTHIPGFPTLDKSPQYYFDRYNNEDNFKDWFDSQFPNQSIEVVGYTKTHILGFPDNSKSPQYYINRYNNEDNYKDWFDAQFPVKTIYQVLGFPDPVSVPDWIKNNAGWWATGKISDKEFVSGIQFMIENNIMIIPNLSDSQTSQVESVPNWIRNNAGWWAYGKISEEEFVGGIKFLVEQGIIRV